MANIYLDIETNGLDPYTCDIVTLQIMTESRRIKLTQDTEEISDKLKDVLEGNLIVGQNIKFDSKFLKHKYGVTLYNVYDTYTAEILLSGGMLAGRKGASLKELVLKYCGVELDKTEQTGFKKGVELTESQIKYAENDVKYLPDIMQQQLSKIKSLGLLNILNTEMKALPAVVWLELSGINIDMNKVNEIKLNLELQRKTALEEVNKEFNPYEVNLNSPKQLLNNLHRIGIQVKNTSAEELSKHNHPVLDNLKKFKEAEKLLNTFVDKVPTFINPITGRIHSNFNQYGAKSGRFTSSNPNLQQQPSKFSAWRSVYRAQPGYKIISADYSQIELRILGEVSKDAEFIKAYKNNMDLHTLTASKIFKVPIESVTKTQRSVAKTVNFGIAYGMWTQGLIGNLNKAKIEMNEAEAEEVIRNFHKAYPSVSNYLRDISKQGLQQLEVRNKAGRLLKFTAPKCQRDEGSIKRESKNLPIQSLCADIVKISMSELFLKLEPIGVKFVNTIHDELVFEVLETQVEYVADVVKKSMESAGSKYLIDVPCIAEVKISDAWEK